MARVLPCPFRLMSCPLVFFSCSFIVKRKVSLKSLSLSLFVALSEDGNSLASSSRPVSPFFHAGCEKKVQARTERRHSRTKGRMSRLARGARTEQHEPRGQHCIANAKNSALSMWAVYLLHLVCLTVRLMRHPISTRHMARWADFWSLLRFQEWRSWIAHVVAKFPR